MKSINSLCKEVVLELLHEETDLKRFEVLLVLLDKIIWEGLTNESDI